MWCKSMKGGKIRNRYNQVLHLTQDITWESDKNTQLNITNKSQEVSPFTTDSNGQMQAHEKHKTFIKQMIQKRSTPWKGQ